MSKKISEPVSDIESRMARAAALDAQIKELTAELNPLKDSLKHDLPAGQTYVAGSYTAKLTAESRLNSRVADVLYGSVPEAHEPKITSASIRAYLTAKYGKKPEKLEAKLAEVFPTGMRIEFGVRS